MHGIPYLVAQMCDCLFLPFLHTEFNYAALWQSEDSGNLWGVVAHTYPGNGRICMPGRFDADVMDGLDVAISWVSSQVGPLCRWLDGGRKRSLLWRSDETLYIYCTGRYAPLGGRSVTAAIALSLVCMLTKRRARQTVVLTGNMDLRGNMLEVEGLQGKLRACQARGMETFLVPEASLAKLNIEELPQDLQAYARRVLRGVRTMTDVIQLSIEGGCRTLKLFHTYKVYITYISHIYNIYIIYYIYNVMPHYPMIVNLVCRLTKYLPWCMCLRY